MIYGTIVGVIFMLSLAFVVYVLANKESGNIKLAGQVLAGLIAVIALLALIYGATGKGCCSMGGKGMMGGKDKCMMMKEMMKKDPSMMQEMCKDPAMKKMMQNAIKKSGK